MRKLTLSLINFPDMSAKKNQSILNFFSRKPASSPGGSNSPSQTQPKNLVSTITKPQKTNEEGDQKPKDDTSLNKSQEDLELDELAKSCLEDDNDDEGMDVSEPKVEKKKRKRISLLEDSSDDEENHSKMNDTPNKRCKLNEVDENKPSSMSTPKSARKFKEKENSSPPSSSKSSGNNVLKDKLSMFSSPSLNKSKTESKSEKPTKEVENDEEDGYMTKVHMNYPFLKPNKIMDKKRRRPDDPDYDPGTLYVPDSFLNDQSPGQRQWWDFKTDHFDKVLFFKMGKFYELFHMGEYITIT